MTWQTSTAIVMTPGTFVASGLLPANAVTAVWIEGTDTLPYEPHLVVYPANSLTLDGAPVFVTGRPTIAYRRGVVLDLRTVLGIGNLRLGIYLSQRWRPPTATVRWSQFIP
jgi:hypothetical protein